MHGPNKVTTPSLYVPIEITTLLPATAHAAFQAFVKAYKHIMKNRNQYITIIFHVNVLLSGQDTEEFLV